MTELVNLSVLLIEPHAGMRAAMHAMLANSGLGSIEHAFSAGNAIRILKVRRFDLIFCEYDLGPGQDGQQLLEDLRNHHIIPLSTMFIMATAERMHERVIGAAELSPTDYILKPFTAEGLQERVEKVVRKREAFLPAYELMEQGLLREAIEFCAEQQGGQRQYAMDFLRLRADLYWRLHEAEPAEQIYRQLVAMKNIAWARLGLAKTLCMREQYEEAIDILQALVDEHPTFLDAHDWLGRAHEAAGQLAQAQAVLERAARISPHGVKRLRKLSAIALETGDMAAAEKSLRAVVEKARYSEFRDPEDNVRLIKALITRGNVEQAAAQIRDLDKTMAGLEKTPACRSISAAMVHEYTGNTDLLSQALQLALDAAHALGPLLSSDVKMELARNCLQNNREAEASEVMLEVMKASPDPATMAKVITIFEEAGRPELGYSLAHESREQVIKLVASGVERARSGDYQGAVDLMSQAVRKMPGNPQVVFNGAVAALKYLQNVGWEDQIGAQARSHIETMRRLDPNNSKLPALIGLYYELLRKYGVGAGRALSD